MTYTMHYDSPLGKILLAAGRRRADRSMARNTEAFLRRSLLQRMKRDNTGVGDACRWLDVYFSGREPDFTPKTPSYRLRFPTGGVGAAAADPLRTDRDLWRTGKQLAEINGGKRVSAQAVGGAVGHNPVSIIVPRHRVVGSDGSLTGYAGGIDKKMRLLTLENAEAANLCR